MMRQVILILLIALSNSFSTGRFAIPLLAVLALAVSQRFFREANKGWQAFLLLWLVWGATTAFAWSGATAMHYSGAMVEFGFFMAMMPIAIIPLVIDRVFHRRVLRGGGNLLLLSLVLPITVAGVDYFSSAGSPFGTFGAAAYSQIGVIGLAQTAAIFGLWLVPFVTAWAASLVNAAWDSQGRERNLTVILFAAVLILPIGGGLLRTAMPLSTTGQVAVGGISLSPERVQIIAANLGSKDLNAVDRITSPLNDELAEKIEDMAQKGAQIISVQEIGMVGTSSSLDETRARVATTAAEHGTYVVLPSVTIRARNEGRPINAVEIFDPTGRVVLTHVKYGGNQFEGTEAGNGVLTSVDTPFGKISAVICWDADFPATIRQLGQQGVELLFVPSNDWTGVAQIHSDMARFRAIENGLTIFRQAGNGISSIIDPLGRILGSINAFETASGPWASEWITDVKVGRANVFYPRLGDVFGQIAALASLILSMYLIATWLRQMRTAA